MFKDKNIANYVNRSSLRASLQHGPYKNKHLEQHKIRSTTRRNRHSKETFGDCVCFHFYLYTFR